jgi:hypothetical protein
MNLCSKQLFKLWTRFLVKKAHYVFTYNL